MNMADRQSNDLKKFIDSKIYKDVPWELLNEELKNRMIKEYQIPLRHDGYPDMRYKINKENF